MVKKKFSIEKKKQIGSKSPKIKIVNIVPQENIKY